MSIRTRRSFRDFWRFVTTPLILRRGPLISIVISTSLVHLITSVDLGFRDLPLRALFAALSMTPAILLIWSAHRLSRESEPLRFALVPLAYLVGGAARGALLQELLRISGVLEGEFASFRVIAGITIVPITCMTVGYTWSAINKAVTTINSLQVETRSLANALENLRLQSDDQNREEIREVQDRVRRGIMQAAQVGPTDVSSQLETLIQDVIKPLSKDFAREVKDWQPPSTKDLRLTVATLWSSLDPVKHIRIPVVAIASMSVSASASIFSLYDLGTALQLISVSTISLLLGASLVFPLITRLFRDLASPWREILLTAGFIAIALSTALLQRWVLAETANPSLYLIPTLLATPITGWTIMIGTAALALSRELEEKLRSIRDDLRWAIARVNMLNWHKKGVISRLLHGPIQNSIQVAVLRMKSADESESMDIVTEMIKRIDNSLKETLDPNTSGLVEIEALREIKETWKSLADVSLVLSDDFLQACIEDNAASSIITDIVEEVCSNAIRHGKAKKISITAEVSQGSIHLQVTDDGSTFDKEDGDRGLGLRFLESCSIEWGRERQEGLNQLNLRLPTHRQLVHSIG